MDEEDGRLGPRARKFGRIDVLTDAWTKSLRTTCRNIPVIQTTEVSIFRNQMPEVSILRPGKDFCTPKDLSRGNL